MEERIKYFEREPGNQSSEKLMSFLSLLAAIALAGYAKVEGTLDTTTIGVVMIFMTGAFAPRKFKNKDK